MIDLETWRKGWAILGGSERRNAWIVLLVVIAAALSSAVMIGSIIPFLSVLAEPARIRSVPALAWAYEIGGFRNDYAFLVALGTASFLIIVAANLIQIVRAWAVNRFALMRMHTISHRLFAAYLRQSYEFFLDHNTASMSTRILSESHQVVNTFLQPAAEVIASVMTVAAIVALLVWVDPAVTVAAFVVLGGIYCGIFALTQRIFKHLGEIRAKENTARFRIASEALEGVKDIKLLGRERSYIDSYCGPSARMARTMVSAGLLSEIPQYVMQVFAFGGMIVISLMLMDPDELASGNALGGILPVLGVFAFAGQRLMPEFSKLYRGLTQLQYGAAAVAAVHADLGRTAAGDTLPRRPPQPLGLKQGLRLEGVTYRYPKSQRSGLSDITLSIRAGEKIGVVGCTGSGKTTLADVILGLLSPSAGRLVVDGTDLTDENIRAWQATVGYVPQDIFLTDGSVAENVALGVPVGEIDRARVTEAACIAQIDRFVREELPQGYETTVGERGVRLSGGQRQRIGIARALYHDADLIVFDEATSALDNLTEREVMAAIEALPGNKTVLIIAHRLSTVERCDRIVVLEDGRVAGCGRWQALMESNHVLRQIALVA